MLPKRNIDTYEVDAWAIRLVLFRLINVTRWLLNKGRHFSSQLVGSMPCWHPSTHWYLVEISCTVITLKNKSGKFHFLIRKPSFLLVMHDSKSLILELLSWKQLLLYHKGSCESSVKSLRWFIVRVALCNIDFWLRVYFDEKQLWWIDLNSCYSG